MQKLFIYSNIDELDASFVAIRKNASTSIAASVWSHKSGINYSSKKFPVDINKTKVYTYTTEEPNLNSFKFIAIRDPFERLVSGFIHKIIKHPHVEGKEYFAYQPDHAKYKNNIPKAFDLFVSFLEKSNINSVDVHFAPQYQLGRFDSIVYDKIIKVENLQDDWKDLQSTIKLPDLPKNKIHFSGSVNYLETLRPVFYDRVFSIYKNDYSLYSTI
jgi:hypothetical protein